MSESLKDRGCPCLYVGACRSSCSCANPIMSGGCDRCASYGSYEQRERAAKHLAALPIEIERLRADLSAASKELEAMSFLAANPHAIQKVKDELGPISLWTASGLEAKLSAAFRRGQEENASLPQPLPALPGQRALTVVMVKDTGDVQADAAIEAVKKGNSTFLLQGVSELFFHQLRLRAALEPTLKDKISVYYLNPDTHEYQEVRLGFYDELRWPVGFLDDAFEKECHINAVRAMSGEDGRDPTKVSDEGKKQVANLRSKYGR